MSAPPAEALRAKGKLPTASNAASSREIRGLDLQHDTAFHHRMWRAQQVGSIALVLLAVAGLAGLLGAGPLSRAETADRALGLQIEYERFGRVDARQAMRVRMPEIAAAADGYRVSVNREFLDRVRLESIVPAPARADAVPGGVVFLFAGRPTAGEPAATFEFTPRSPGILRGHVGVPGAAPLAIRQLVYP